MELIKYIIENCPSLEFKGLMSMGKLNDIEGFAVRMIEPVSLI